MYNRKFIVLYVGDRRYFCPNIITLVVVPCNYPGYFYLHILLSLVEYIDDQI